MRRHLLSFLSYHNYYADARGEWRASRLKNAFYFLLPAKVRQRKNAVPENKTKNLSQGAQKRAEKFGKGFFARIFLRW